MGPNTVMIAEDDTMLREALAMVLAQEEDIQVVGGADEGAQSL